MKQSFGEKLKALFSKSSSINEEFFEELTHMLVEGDIGAKLLKSLMNLKQFVIKKRFATRKE